MKHPDGYRVGPWGRRRALRATVAAFMAAVLLAGDDPRRW